MKDQALYDKLVARVNKDPFTGCWIWLGPGFYKRKSPGNRYGYIGVRIRVGIWKNMCTHKAMWRALHGEPTKGMCVCHSCDNPRCVNPDHLWLGTHLQNMADCRAKNRYHYSNLTHCKRGHPFDEQNTYIIKTPGETFGLRACKACMRARGRIKAGWPEHLAYALPAGNYGESWQSLATRLGFQEQQKGDDRA